VESSSKNEVPSVFAKSKSHFIKQNLFLVLVLVIILVLTVKMEGDYK